MGERMENILGYMEVEMDGRFSSIRTQETNLGELTDSNRTVQTCNSAGSELDKRILRVKFCQALHSVGEISPSK